MRLYFAGAESGIPLLREAGVERALVAFSASSRSIDRVLGAFPDVLLDSGAWSAFNSGTPIDLNRYIAFIKERDLVTYAALDVIGDYKATLKNADAMVKAGLSPIVAFHFGSPYAVLERMVRKYDYIALGGLVPIGNARTKLLQHLDSCFSIIGKEAKRTGRLVKVHGFGVQQRWALERYPFYSVDSTTWQNASRYGAVIDETGAQRTSVKVGGVAKARAKAGASTGYAVQAIVNMDDADKRLVYNARATRRIEAEVTKLWAARGITWED